MFCLDILKLAVVPHVTFELMAEIKYFFHMLINTKAGPRLGTGLEKNILLHWERKRVVHLVAVCRCYLKPILNPIIVQSKTAKRKLLLFILAAIEDRRHPTAGSQASCSACAADFSLPFFIVFQGLAVFMMLKKLLLDAVLCRVESSSPDAMLYTFLPYVKASQLPSTFLTGRVHGAALGSLTSPHHFPKPEAEKSLWHSPVHPGCDQLILAVQ